MEINILNVEESHPKENKKGRIMKQVPKTQRNYNQKSKNAEPSSLLYVEGSEEYASHFAHPPKKIMKAKLTKKKRSRSKKVGKN